MKRMTSDEIFIEAVSRVNRYLIMMSIFFFAYFLLRTKVDIFLLFLALSYIAFVILSYRHLAITNRLLIELERAKLALEDVSKETRQMS